VSLGGVPVRDALDSAVIALRAGGVESPRLDAEVLLAHALGVERTALVLDPERPVEGPAVRIFQEAVRRRAVEREPVAYITGLRAFRRLVLAVDRRVLIPRPETELLVEAALRLPHGTRVLDVGTGSGAVALALKDERGDLIVTGIDVSLEALAVARANAQRLGLEVDFVKGDLLDGAPAAEAVAANLPYVESGAQLEPEIALHEPAIALRAGPDGLEVVRRLIEQAASGPARWIALELGVSQAGAVERLARAAGFGDVQLLRDLAGVERVAVAQR
jgi:release factor glutamine methyltransferase